MTQTDTPYARARRLRAVYPRQRTRQLAAPTLKAVAATSHCRPQLPAGGRRYNLHRAMAVRFPLGAAAVSRERRARRQPLRSTAARHLHRVAALLLTLLGLVGMLAASAAAPAAAATSATPPPTVHLLTVDGVINPLTARYLERGVRAAATAGADAVVLQLNTPGGLDSSMRQIMQAMLGSPVPVVVYVAPPGARAASAGVFITIASHVAAMAP